MRPAPLLLTMLPFLGGCLAPTIREYTYDIDIHNTTQTTVSLELLQARSSNINKLRTDLAPGGVFANAYTIRGEAEYLEARLRPACAPDTAPWQIHELPRGRIRYNITEEAGRVALVPRRPQPADELP
jgi:hypothetical protein